MKRDTSHRQQLQNDRVRDDAAAASALPIAPPSSTTVSAPPAAPARSAATPAPLPTPLVVPAVTSGSTNGTVASPPRWRGVSKNEIGTRAYENYQKSGGLAGKCESNWLDAERALRSEAVADSPVATVAAGNEMVSEGGGSAASSGSAADEGATPSPRNAVGGL